jgi:pSer/pThr/pTyr-binding forkhead associated (FHA) protein
LGWSATGADASEPPEQGDGYAAQGVAIAEPTTFLLLGPGTPEERRVPVQGRMFIGRDCSGVAEEHRLVIDHPEVSRHHLEIRLDPERGRACAIDTSTNGTRLNGVRLERAEPVTIRSGDRLAVGPFVLEFRSAAYRDSGIIDTRRTNRPVRGTPLILVVGDIVDYSGVSRGGG